MYPIRLLQIDKVFECECWLSSLPMNMCASSKNICIVLGQMKLMSWVCEISNNTSECLYGFTKQFSASNISQHLLVRKCDRETERERENAIWLTVGLGCVCIFTQNVSVRYEKRRNVEHFRNIRNRRASLSLSLFHIVHLYFRMKLSWTRQEQNGIEHNHIQNIYKIRAENQISLIVVYFAAQNIQHVYCWLFISLQRISSMENIRTFRMWTLNMFGSANLYKRHHFIECLWLSFTVF